MNDPATATLSPNGPGPGPHHAEERAIETFDALGPGGTMTLVLDRAPAALLARLQEERRGQFDWTPVGEGPPVWEVEVSRREAVRGDLRGVNEALAWDHDRLDQLEARAFAARSAGDFAEAVALYSRFAFGLRRHIRFEEELLFPEFETKCGFSSHMGPTAVMRAEHREILDWVQRIEEAIGDSRAAVESLRRGLHAVLVPHNLKEEAVVYPGTDDALTEVERDDLVARIQSL